MREYKLVSMHFNRSLSLCFCLWTGKMDCSFCAIVFSFDCSAFAFISYMYNSRVILQSHRVFQYLFPTWIVPTFLGSFQFVRSKTCTETDRLGKNNDRFLFFARLQFKADVFFGLTCVCCIWFQNPHIMRINRINRVNISNRCQK